VRSSAWPTAGIASTAPILAILGFWLVPSPSYRSPWVVLAIASLALLITGGLVTMRRVRSGRVLSTAGIGGFLASFLVTTPLSPTLALFTVLLAIALLGSIWGVEVAAVSRLSRRQQRELTATRAHLATVLYLFDWFLVVPLEVVRGPGSVASLALGLALAFGFSIAWTLRARRTDNPRWKWPVIALGLAAVGVAFFHRDAGHIASWAAIAPIATLVASYRRTDANAIRTRWWHPMTEHPARLLVITFVILCLAGTVLLVLPASAADGRSIGFIDAAFTSVSAVCVTGLIVRDTPVAFGRFGEVVLLLLIQLGGLGIMSFSTVTLSFFGFRPSLRHEAAVAGLVGTENRGAMAGALTRLLQFTILAECAGALVLALAFYLEGSPLDEALWHGLFTSVSAFCNAGFALWSDSLMSFRQAPWILHTVGLLIILGGLSPATVLATTRLARGRRVAVEHKIAIVATVVLLAFGTLAFLALEWNQTLARLSPWDRVHNAWFQSVTARTAGFNSVDMAAVRPATITLLIALMFVGGSPGGTAGGIKTTTGVVLLLAVVSAVRGRWVANAFGRRLSHRTVYKAASIVTLGVLSLLMALFALQLTQNMNSRMAIFEAASALGTVGLSVGGTAVLDNVGKVIIMICMFAGRVGPLSLFLFLGARTTMHYWDLVEEEVAVG
jgi:trk system potassium uptake protein TrkH